MLSHCCQRKFFMWHATRQKKVELPSRFNPFNSSTLLTFNMQATRKSSTHFIQPVFATTEIISLGSSDVECCFVWRATSHPAPQIYGWSPQRAPYRHSLLLKFLHISSFTYCMMILYPSPISCPFLICNKICIKNKTSAATPKNCCVRIYFVFFLFWKGQGLCCYFSSLVTLLDPAHKDIYANCAPLGSRPSMRI